ncbi:MAG: TonB-dependent receptor plug domain-containing protein [Thermoanaerobaculum sp.]
MKPWSRFVFGLCFLSLPLAAQQPTFSEAVVVTASGEEEALDTVPAAVSLVDGEELARSLDASVAGLLRRLPGVTVLRSGLDGGVTSLFSRGTNSTHTLVLFEGIRLNDPYFGGYDWSLPLTSGVGKVEVVRGPFSALYGADALGGVVQLFAPRAAENHWQAAAEAGSDGWRRLSAALSWAQGPWDVAVAGGAREGGGALVNDDFWGKALTLSAGFHPRPDTRLGVLVRSSRTHTEIPFSGAHLTPHRFTAAEETLVGLPFRASVGRGVVLEGNVARVEGELRFRDPDDPWGYTAGDTQTESLQGRLVLRAQVGRHRLQVGGEWRRDEVTASSSFGPALADRRQEVRSLFVQERVLWGRRGELTAGLRYDRAGSWEEVSPRLTASHPFPWGRLWVAAGKGFRAPSLGELYYPYSGNPGLQPERSASLEVGLAAPVGRSWLLQVVPFAARITNLVDFDFATWRFANVAQARQKGVELSVERRERGLLVRAAGTFLHAEDGEGRRLLRRPRWSGSFTAGKDWAWGKGEASLVYLGRRPDIHPVSFARVDNGGFFTANLAVTLPVRDALSVTVRVENLADRAYQEVRGYPAPGRRVFVGFSLGSF